MSMGEILREAVSWKQEVAELKIGGGLIEPDATDLNPPASDFGGGRTCILRMEPHPASRLPGSGL
jgi:hypothetical protein